MDPITWRKATPSNEHGGSCGEVARISPEQWRVSHYSDDKGGACVEVARIAPGQWRKAEQSNDQGHECAELAALSGGVGVRDSKDPDGPKLVLNRNAFRSLVNELKQR
ncbi:DUF397 domain-containing protein [Actinomadura rifamycini]|uniref:DUF397 domain-containing protein n=1 Tax=Actinomadura rifamycini TaxID=31962 RepID=UPI000552B08F|nr:DUF397 domain-containing protein [Actinomadura rifamycini]